jgi:hypothetical protein
MERKNMSEEQAQQTASPNLTIADLILTAQIIQAAANKAVFRAEEFKAVGDFYERLIGFLESSGAIQRSPTVEAAVQETAAQETAAQEETPAKEKDNVKTRRKA